MNMHDHSSHSSHNQSKEGRVSTSHSKRPAQHQHESKDQTGHDVHEGHSVADFRKRFVISSLLTIPVLSLSHMIQQWLGYSWTFPGDRYVLSFFSTVIFIYGGYPFLKGLYAEVKSGVVGMMTLIGIAISVSWLYSLGVIFGLKGMDFFWEMATLIDIMLIGHYLEMKSVSGASRSLELLVKLMPSTAHHLVDGHIHDIPVEYLKKDDLILIRPGEKIPVDGIITEGESYLDESMLTGESKPAKKKAGSKVVGGSLNGNGSIKVLVTHSGKEGYLNKVIKLVEDAQKVKSRTQTFADRAAKWLTYLALLGGILTLAVWLLLGYPFVFALERMVTVMVISCPHALGLAVPLVVAISTAVSAQKGLLIKNRTAFENAGSITTVLFDKTGTLTMGAHTLSEVHILDDRFAEDEIIRLASGVEQYSEHYIAQGFLKRAEEKAISIPKAEKFNYIPGQGIEASIDGMKINVVGPNYFAHHNMDYPGLEDDENKTIVYVLVDDRVIAYCAFSDHIRESAFEAIRILKEAGIENLLITGDNELVAKSVCQRLKMDGYVANVLPHDKLEKVKALQEKGHFVAMTGDGVNDAPALARADIGIAVGSGTDIAAETADIILVNSDPKDITSLIMFGKATYNKMIQNLWWAAGYNIFAIPLAAGVFFKWGVMLNPAFGAILMSLSTIVVAINAQLLKDKLN